jgi:hypothetical protein
MDGLAAVSRSQARSLASDGALRTDGAGIVLGKVLRIGIRLY